MVSIVVVDQVLLFLFLEVSDGTFIPGALDRPVNLDSLTDKVTFVSKWSDWLIVSDFVGKEVDPVLLLPASIEVLDVWVFVFGVFIFLVTGRVMSGFADEINPAGSTRVDCIFSLVVVSIQNKTGQ